MAASKPGSAALVPGLPAGDSRMRIAALLLGWRSHASCPDQTWIPGLYDNDALLSLRPSTRTHVTLSRAPPTAWTAPVKQLQRQDGFRVGGRYAWRP
jgi:hypothetical protein